MQQKMNSPAGWIAACGAAATLSCGVSTSATVTAYPAYPGAPQSTYCSVSVDGTPVFVHQYKEKSYTHFAFTGEVTVTITSTTTSAITSYDIQPHPYNIKATIDGNRLSFKLDRPRKLIISLSGPYRFNNPALFIFAEAPEVNAPKLGDPGVTNIMDYGVDNTGIIEMTAKLNQSIADVSAKPEGGVVFVPKGRYKCATIIMKSRVTLYLEGDRYAHCTNADRSVNCGTLLLLCRLFLGQRPGSNPTHGMEQLE